MRTCVVEIRNLYVSLQYGYEMGPLYHFSLIDGIFSTVRHVMFRPQWTYKVSTRRSRLADDDTAASATDDITRILIYQTVPTTRSIVEDMPEASVRNDLLTVSFDGAGTYSLYVKDSFGVTVYSSALPANGMEYDYDSYFTKMKELVPSKTQELNILYHSNKVRRSHERNSSSGIPPVPTTSE